MAACSNDGACHISRIIAFARPCTDCGILSSTLPALWKPAGLSSVPDGTSAPGAQPSSARAPAAGLRRTTSRLGPVPVLNQATATLSAT